MTETAVPQGPPRARGDVDGRRRDVLAAAAELLDEHGADFSMRQVAERAGVSAGAVYQWFKGKVEILAVLHAEGFDRETERLRALPGDLGFEETVEEVLCGMAEIWSELGHHRTMLVDADDPSERSAFIDTLVGSFRALTDEIDRRLRAAATRSGLELRPAEEMLPWLWAVCIGAGTQILDIRYVGAPSTRAYVTTLVPATAAGLVAPSEPASAPPSPPEG